MRQVVGFLTCLGDTGEKLRGLRVYEWRCVCGNVIHRTRSNYGRTNQTASCGCMTGALVSKANKVHGASLRGTPAFRLFVCWQSMIWRCYNKNRRDYAYYGGRGVVVCERWRNSFQAFALDMGDKPEGMSIDRIDCNGNYEPGNCRWATNKQQSNNKRNNRVIVANGEARTISQWAESLGVDHSAIAYRLRKGWPADAAVSLPKRSKPPQLVEA